MASKSILSLKVECWCIQVLVQELPSYCRYFKWNMEWLKTKYFMGGSAAVYTQKTMWVFLQEFKINVHFFRIKLIQILCSKHKRQKDGGN